MGNFVEAKLVILLSLIGSGASSSLDPRLPFLCLFIPTMALTPLYKVIGQLCKLLVNRLYPY